MPSDTKFSRDHSTLLVIDVQTRVVQRFASYLGLLDPIIQAVRVAFHSGYPEVSPANRSFAGLAKAGASMTEQDTSATAIHPALPTAPDDIVVTKRRVSAFTGSDLDVVLSSVREAAERDYQLTVLADASMDLDPEVHRVLVDKVFPRQAEVVTVATWAERLGITTDA